MTDEPFDRANPKITFSHLYPKLDVALDLTPATEPPTATLLEVLPVRLEKLSDPFLLWDTDNGLYELPKKGKYLLLLFRGQRGLFPTLRRWTQPKENYYILQLGKKFDVIITPEAQ